MENEERYVQTRDITKFGSKSGEYCIKHPGEPDEIVWEPQAPLTIEDATVSRETLGEIARLLGFDPNEVHSIYADARQVTIHYSTRKSSPTGAHLITGFCERVKHVIR
jgi:hypothetical protein